MFSVLGVGVANIELVTKENFGESEEFSSNHDENGETPLKGNMLC